ncbi:helix-turn-helix domain-containing protein [Pontibacter amylolyticus]|uniref:AraC family transcriptional regulator n=1 Tax=Pontibacter amylolyticus TaxID=1424080 RepID=A0ABQ1W4D6_9BACT|nr:helix-turn-helix domain-containing protein [Pontibacter amylolyticus]GGG13706.1 AraC family transcriptional regulator [Pontibacter amylolyticus]
MSTNDHFPTLGIQEFQPAPQPVHGLQYLDVQGKQQIDRPHKHDFFMLLLFEEGSGTHTIDFEEYAVDGGQLHLLLPGQVHRWSLGENTRACQLMVSRPVFETFSSSLELSFVLYRKHPVISLAPDTFRKLRYEFLAVRDELNSKPVDWAIVKLRSQIVAQLVSHEAESKNELSSVYRAAPALLKYQHLVDACFKEQKTVAFYAEKLHISANYLNILCRKHLQVSAMYLVQNRVTLEAKRLLRASDMSIKEIAFELGFSDLAYFSNFFKGQTGSSPRLFRSQL